MVYLTNFTNLQTYISYISIRALIEFLSRLFRDGVHNARVLNFVTISHNIQSRIIG